MEINLRRQKCGYRHLVLIILGNHSSTGSIDQEKLWTDHEIKFLFISLIFLYEIQPLDQCPNVMYKRLLQKDYHQHDEDRAYERRNRVLLAWISSLQTALSPGYRNAGWKDTGLYPFNPEQILEDSLVAKDIDDNIPVFPEAKRLKRINFNGGTVLLDYMRRNSGISAPVVPETIQQISEEYVSLSL